MKVSAIHQRHGVPEEPQEAAAESAGFTSQLIMLAVPLDFFQRLSEEAAARNMRVAELLSRAVEDYLKRTAPNKE